jgi:hypothetical protein
MDQLSNLEFFRKVAETGEDHCADGTAALDMLKSGVPSDGKDNMMTPSVMVAHELRHVWDRMRGVKNRDETNRNAVDFENKVRRLQFPNGPTRRFHNPP